jgi:hypothetical protein
MGPRNKEYRTVSGMFRVPYFSHHILSIRLLQSDVEVAAANILDLFAKIEPSRMTSKIKLHLLTHLKADILCFGPLVGVATEVFECFNVIFRYCSIYSNHLAPSRDIAFQLASQEAIKCRLTGGLWRAADGQWKQPGPLVRNFIHDNPTLQALVGWSAADPLVNNGSDNLFLFYCSLPSQQLGSFKLEPLKCNARQNIQSLKYISWLQTQGSKAVNPLEDANSEWAPCRYVAARSGDKCLVRS